METKFKYIKMPEGQQFEEGKPVPMIDEIFTVSSQYLGSRYMRNDYICIDFRCGHGEVRSYYVDNDFVVTCNDKRGNPESRTEQLRKGILRHYKNGLEATESYLQEARQYLQDEADHEKSVIDEALRVDLENLDQWKKEISEEENA